MRFGGSKAGFESDEMAFCVVRKVKQTKRVSCSRVQEIKDLSLFFVGPEHTPPDRRPTIKSVFLFDKARKTRHVTSDTFEVYLGGLLLCNITTSESPQPFYILAF